MLFNNDKNLLSKLVNIFSIYYNKKFENIKKFIIYLTEKSTENIFESIFRYFSILDFTKYKDICSYSYSEYIILNCIKLKE